MSQYYYTIAALPFIDFESALPMELDHFLKECEKECNPRDYSLIKDSGLVPPLPQKKYPAILTAFYSWERSLRNELVVLRSKKKGVSPDMYVQDGETVFEPVQVARNAFNQESPLTGEQIIRKARWTLLDHLEAGHYFDVEKLIIYKLKLEILGLKGKSDKTKGEESYQHIINKFEEELNSLEIKDE
ncbi:MAG: DUF2764 family protein [Spirochaetales bacterium]|nr:DUF2764 family protein [Spirochaetales bacterium]